MTDGTSTAAAAGTLLGTSRRRRRAWDRASRRSVPYLLIAPVVAVIALILGYPLYYLVRISLEQYGLAELIQHKGPWVGLANYRSVLHDQIFWHTLVRTVVFTAANVALTIVIGLLLALLLTRLSTWVRVLLSSGLVLVWSMPVVVAVQVWYWMTNFENGVLNYVLTKLGIGDYTQHDWYATPFSQLTMATLLIVWGALPFVTITLYAGLAQVPGDLLEAASVDGAAPWRVFRDITLPLLKPILLILTSLSIIWDFGVFTQAYLVTGELGNRDEYNLGIYAYDKAFTMPPSYGFGSAIALVLTVILLIITVGYVRASVRQGAIE